MKAYWHTALIVFGLIGVFAMQSCTYGSMRAPASAGMVVYTKGARQHTATVQIVRPPAEVYAAMLRILARRPDLKVINNDEKHYLLEVTEGGKNLTGQATQLDSNSTLFFIWADAGDSGQTGQDLALDAMREVCTELKVQCTMQGL